MEKQKEFFDLCKKGKFEEVKLILSQMNETSKNEFINFVNKQGNNAIISASQSGNVDLVDFLYKNGADISSENLKTSTLLRAIQSGNHKLVRYLINLGVNPCYQPVKSQAPHFNLISYAILYTNASSLEVIRELVENGGYYYFDSLLTHLYSPIFVLVYSEWRGKNSKANEILEYIVSKMITLNKKILIKSRSLESEIRYINSKVVLENKDKLFEVVEVVDNNILGNIKQEKLRVELPDTYLRMKQLKYIE